VFNSEKLPPHNLGLFRLEKFVGRAEELEQLRNLFKRSPVIAITGPSGAGKSTLATALAVTEASRFREGILHITATGESHLGFYDIIRAVEDVLATGITTHPISSWPVLLLQQLYGFRRLLILDELTDAAPDTVAKIIRLIHKIGPGGRGRFILVGRSLPKALLKLVGDAHLVLDGLDVAAVADWLELHQEIYPLTPKDALQLHKISGGHPLALKLVGGLWNTPDWAMLIDLVSVQRPDDWSARLKFTVTAALAYLDRTCPEASQLLTEYSQASGGGTIAAIESSYWRPPQNRVSLKETLQILVRHGLLMVTPNQKNNRYFIHPLIRRFLDKTWYANLKKEEQHRYTMAHARYYLTAAQKFTRLSSDQWPTVSYNWGNIRKGFSYLIARLEDELGMSLELLPEQTALLIDAPTLSYSSVDLDEVLILLRDYALALRSYIVQRHPPEGHRIMLSGVVASRHLLDRRAEALIAITLGDLAYYHLDYSTAQILYRRSLPFFKEVKDHAQVIHVTRNLGIVLRGMNRLDESLKKYHQALALAEKFNLYPELATIQTAIASTYYHQKEYQQAVDCYQKAISLDKKNNNEPWQAAHHNNMGLALEALGQYNVAIEHYRQAVKFHKKVQNKKGLSITCSNLGAVYYQINRPQKALEQYGRAKTIRDSLGHWLDKAAILHNMGHIALELGDFPQSAAYFTQSKDLYLRFGQTNLADEEQLMLEEVAKRQKAEG